MRRIDILFVVPVVRTNFLYFVFLCLLLYIWCLIGTGSQIHNCKNDPNEYKIFVYFTVTISFLRSDNSTDKVRTTNRSLRGNIMHRNKLVNDP